MHAHAGSYGVGIVGRTVPVYVLRAVSEFPAVGAEQLRDAHGERRHAVYRAGSKAYKQVSACDKNEPSAAAAHLCAQIRRRHGNGSRQVYPHRRAQLQCRARGQRKIRRERLVRYAAQAPYRRSAGSQGSKNEGAA